MSKTILIITNYYPPEIGAASNRIFHLAEGLKNKGHNITILTPLPNYPKGEIFKDYKGEFSRKSVENDIAVNRLWIFASNSKNKFLRLFAMLSYSFSLTWFFIWNKIPRTVIIQSPPLLVSFTALLFLRFKKRKLILNVSDLWPLAGLKLNALKKGIGYSLLEYIERFNYKKASLVLCQSKEIEAHIHSIYQEKDTLLYRNYPDFEPPKVLETKKNDSKIKVVYAGLLGVAQGIYKLIQELNYDAIELHIYGSGSEKEIVLSHIKNNPNLPIHYHGELDRTRLHKVLLKYDITIIPLLNRIYGSVPSKIFEYSRLGLPILYFGGGEGESIVTKNNLGWVAESGNYNALNDVIKSIVKEDFSTSIKKEIQKKALQEFNLESQINSLEQKL
ncbi:glycosyltransferase family 4 protein [Ichthyenterobacterium sp. W332]|uniref:Glycosyltransferase family 4 protein n=1 Tax=Microcosmobacter mediterraneus TaxID=3075607 RepID=A0ABU2YJK8_9FLAO|nr:glycosyltransferase family 4 protein [Ichthyenterobacterium sp. W332]MDT0558071.1 glycosyltransferase family 4 protein [Ichthyenterobacterium sp. W332]